MTEIKKRIESYFDRLWPINRSIMGPGFRQSLDILAEILPFQRLKFETGTEAFDWIVPKEWHVENAYFIDPNGNKHADFKDNNLHLVGYSSPFEGKLSFNELRSHLHSLPEQPTAIPYITSYYKEDWGFCLTHNELQNLPEGEYEVYIDSKLYPGHLEIGEVVLPGTSKQEVLFSSYLCHPSLANNELSGPLVMTFLYERLKAMPKRKYTYRFVISAETIGTICYLSVRGKHLKQYLSAGYQMTCLGDRGHFTYKLSRHGNTLADRAAQLVLRDHGVHNVIPFDPGNGSDERQYCSPGFNLPFGSLMRTMYSCYPEYHTSLDNKEFISFDAMVESVEVALAIVNALESNSIWLNTIKYCEPQLGRKGLYPTKGSGTELPEKLKAMMWLLNLADGNHDLFSIAEKSYHKLETLISVIHELSTANLLKPK
jgi:aminopeptidase-like protein